MSHSEADINFGFITLCNAEFRALAFGLNPTRWKDPVKEQKLPHYMLNGRDCLGVISA